MLNSDWSEKASLVERWRFWCAYLAERQGWKLADPRRAAGEIAWLTRDYACRIQRGRAKRHCTPTATSTHSTRHKPADTRLPRLPRLTWCDCWKNRNDTSAKRRTARPTGAAARRCSAASCAVAGQATPIAWHSLPARPWWRAWSAPTGRSRRYGAGTSVMRCWIVGSPRHARWWFACLAVGPPDHLATWPRPGSKEPSIWPRTPAGWPRPMRTSGYRVRRNAPQPGRFWADSCLAGGASGSHSPQSAGGRERPDSLEVWLSNVNGIRLGGG